MFVEMVGMAWQRERALPDQLQERRCELSHRRARERELLDLEATALQPLREVDRLVGVEADTGTVVTPSCFLNPLFDDRELNRPQPRALPVPQAIDDDARMLGARD